MKEKALGATLHLSGTKTWEEWECGCRYVHALCVCTPACRGVRGVRGCVCMYPAVRGGGWMHVCV